MLLAEPLDGAFRSLLHGEPRGVSQFIAGTADVIVVVLCEFAGQKRRERGLARQLEPAIHGGHRSTEASRCCEWKLQTDGWKLEAAEEIRDPLP